MAAGAEGAGLEHSLGVNIRLPFEQARERVHRGRHPPGRDEVLLHPQAHAHEGIGGIRGLARWVRHPRRGLRAPDAPPDGQIRTRTDRAARGAGGHVLARLGTLHHRRRGTRSDRPRRHRALPHHRRRRRRGRRAHRLLPQLSLHPLRRRPPRRAAAGRPERRSVDPDQRGVLRHLHDRPHQSPPRRSRPRWPTTTPSNCRASSSTSIASPTGDFGP